MDIENEAYYHPVNLKQPVVTEFKVFINGLEIRSDDKITEVQITAISDQTIPPYTFKTNA
jgi:hypothetical protein